MDAFDEIANLGRDVHIWEATAAGLSIQTAPEAAGRDQASTSLRNQAVKEGVDLTKVEVNRAVQVAIHSTASMIHNLLASRVDGIECLSPLFTNHVASLLLDTANIIDS